MSIHAFARPGSGRTLLPPPHHPAIRLRVLSLGAGVQSTTLALLAAHDEIGPMPDCAIFADTGWEPKAVYAHLDWLRSPNRMPFPIHVVSSGDQRADLVAGAAGNRWASIPAFTRTVTPAGTTLPVYGEDEDGDAVIVGTRILATERVKVGMIRRQCTGDFKVVPIRRKVRELLGIVGGSGRSGPTMSGPTTSSSTGRTTGASTGCRTSSMNRRTAQRVQARVPRHPGRSQVEGAGVIDVLSDLFNLRGVPGHIRSDNGPEFIAKAVRDSIAAVGSQQAYIEPGSPWENGFCDIFNAKPRDELLNGDVFYTLKEACIVIEQWRRHGNTLRSHSSLGYQPPAPEVVIWPTEPSKSVPSVRPAIVTRPTIH